MFVMDQKLSQQYPWPVTVEFVTADGTTETQSFTALFKRFPQPELDALTESVRKGKSDQELVSSILAGWEGVVDDDGNAVAFSQDAIPALVKNHPTRPTLIRAWYASLEGARLKN